MEIESLNFSNLTIATEDDVYVIPHWVLVEVLLRLPLNSVFTCRCVSKRWLSVASDPDFIRAYANSRASASSPPPWIALSPYVSRDEKLLPTLVPNPSNHFIPRELSLPPHLSIRPHGVDIAGHCSVVGVSNGLVLCCSSTPFLQFDRLEFYVCDPVTGHRVRSSRPVRSQMRLHRVKCGWGFLTSVDGESTLKSYRIVYARQSWKNLNTVIAFNVYHSEIGSWKKFTAPLCNGPSPYELVLQPSGAVLNGILYWADIRRGVIMYDPEANPEQQIRIIQHPYDVERRYDMWYAYLCMAYRGELRYYGGHPIDTQGFPTFSIWKLVDYSSGEWCCQHRIERTGIDADIYRRIGPKMTVEILCFDPFDPDVVYLINGDRSTFSYNLRTKTIEDQFEMILNDDPPSWCDIRQNLVLVVPPWPVRVAEKHLERRREV